LLKLTNLLLIYIYPRRNNDYVLTNIEISIYIIIMIFRTITGELIEINKYDFKDDILYYQKIMEIKQKFTKLEKTLDHKNSQHS
jgi:hypothetical protein